MTRLLRIPVTIALALVMVLTFVLELWIRYPRKDWVEVLVYLGAITPTTFQSGQYWRLLTAIFLHAGFLHLFFNVWIFVQVGYLIERASGSWRLIVLFVVTGLSASIVSASHAEVTAVGASGAIFGLIGFLVFWLWRHPAARTDRYAARLAIQLGVWAALAVMGGFLDASIDNAAHVGGLVSGAVLGYFGSAYIPLAPARRAEPPVAGD